MKNDFGMPEFIGLIFVALFFWFLFKGVGFLINGAGETSCHKYGNNIEFSILQGCKIYVDGQGYIPENLYIKQYEQNIKIKKD